jgi:hypothetical protein
MSTTIHITPLATVRSPMPALEDPPFGPGEGYNDPGPSLPPGLTRNLKTGAISGIPTTPGTYVVNLYQDRDDITVSIP